MAGSGREEACVAGAQRARPGEVAARGLHRATVRSDALPLSLQGESGLSEMKLQLNPEGRLGWKETEVGRNTMRSEHGILKYVLDPVLSFLHHVLHPREAG